MALQGMEPVVKAISTILSAGMDAALTAEEAKWSATDPISLPRPAATSYFICEQLVMETHPAIVIIGERVDHGYQTSHAEYFTQDEGGGGYTVTVIYVNAYDDPLTLRKMCYRTSTAIAQILATNFDLGGVVMIAKVEYQDFSQAGTSDGNVFEQSVEIGLTVQTEEAI